MPSADFDALEGLAGVPGSIAVVEATVVGEVGGEIEIVEGGYADWGDEYPILRVSEISGLTIVEEDLEDVISRALASDQIDLFHTNGVLEEGERYAFFLGRWDEESLSFLYAHHLLDDSAAPGFASPYTDAVLDSMEIRGAVSDLDRVEALVDSTPVQARVEVTPDLALPGYFPQFDEELEAEVAAVAQSARLLQNGAVTTDYVRLEVAVLLPSGLSGTFGLRSVSDKRVLGWFEPGDRSASYVVIDGFVPDGERLELVRLVGKRAKRVKLKDYGFSSNRFRVDGGEQSYFGAILDISDDSTDKRAKRSDSEIEWSSAFAEALN